MSARACIPVAIAVAATVFAATPALAQNREITDQLAEQLVRAFAAEQAALETVATQVAEIDDKIRKFNECKEVYEAAADVSGSRLGGLAARAAIRARCGATDTDGFLRDKRRLLEGPERAALQILNMRTADYGRLKERVVYYFRGERTGYSSGELAVLEARGGDLATALRVDRAALAAAGHATQQQGGGGNRGGRGGRGLNAGWTTDYAWEYIGEMFQIMYVSGATVFELPYQPGQWTRWDIVSRDARMNGDNSSDAELTHRRSIERAFIGRTEDGGEWWRTTSIETNDDSGTQKPDTVVLESLFKPLGEHMKQLVRVRARLPGQEPGELMVPQHMAMLSLLSVFPMRPTPESIQGATVGTERAGGHDARHVRFGAGGGSIEWWLADAAPGGWVRFRMTEPRDADVAQPGSYTVEMTGSGTGARSLLGVM
jgi:hypothetical protein